MRIWGNFSKVDEQLDGTLIVSGICSSDTKDADGEIITSNAIKQAIPDYMRFGAVREQHDPMKAAGTALLMEVQEDGKTNFEALVVDPIAITKVKTGVYKGFSIGGRVLERDMANKKIIKGIRLTEVSLVDRPANPDSVFTLVKLDDPEDDDKIGIKDDTHGLPNSAIETSEKNQKESDEKNILMVERDAASETPEPRSLDNSGNAEPQTEKTQKEETTMENEIKPEIEKANQQMEKIKEACMHMEKAMKCMMDSGMMNGDEEKTEVNTVENKESEVTLAEKNEDLNKSESFSKLENENKELKEKLAKSELDLANLLEETNKTVKNIQEKGFLKAVAVTKSQDGITKADENEPTNPIDAIKKALSQGKPLF